MTSSAAAFNALSRRHDWEQFCDPTLAFDHGDHARVLEIWRAQAGADIPARSAMSARLLKPFLPQIGLVERVATDPPRYRWRLLGTGAVQVLGERTGTCFEDNASPRQAARWNASASLVLELRRPLRFVARVAIEGKEFLANESLLMPLADDDGDTRFVMGYNRYEYGTTWEQAAAQARRAAERG